MTRYAELEIGLHRWDDKAYELDFRFTEPNADAEVRPSLANPVVLDFNALREVSDNPVEYGRRLSTQFFSDRAIAEAFVAARAAADTARIPIRMRLRISPNAAKLHTIRWETLQDPSLTGPLLTNENIVFSRAIDSGLWKRVRVKPEGTLRALVVIANPSDLATIRTTGAPLAAIDVEQEAAAAKARLAGYEIEVLASKGKATLANVIDGIRRGVDLIYLLCHGFVLRDEPRLLFENEDGTKDVVEARALIRQIRDLREPPRLVVLASCQSGGAEQDERTGQVVSRLGPQLAEAGVPAVVAMQGNVTVETASTFLSKLFSELRTDGEIDRAMAAARASVQDRSDSWMPALYMRLKTGKIWFDTESTHPAGSFSKWDAILEHLRNGRCTPILGFGVYESLFGPSAEIARRWADTYRYPFALDDRDDLPQVAQYLAVNHDNYYPRYELQKHFRREIQHRYGQMIAGDPLTMELDSLITSAWEKATGPTDAHRILARLPCPAYVTTNLSTILERALAEVNRPSVSAVCPWYPDAHRETLPAPLTKENPVVYHLFGRLDVPDSIVISEDDYFDYLIGTTENKDLIDSSIRGRFNSSSLMFLGFQASDWNFRALFRSLVRSEGRVLRSRFAHVAVQVNPHQSDVEEPDVVYAYLERYFQKEQITIFRGTVAEFIEHLAERWKTKFGEDLTKK